MLPIQIYYEVESDYANVEQNIISNWRLRRVCVCYYIYRVYVRLRVYQFNVIGNK